MRSKANRSGKQADSRGRSPTRKHLKPAAIARKRVSRSLERLAPTNNTQFGKINNVRRGSEDSVRGVSSSVSKTKPVSTANYIDLEDPDGLHEPLKSPLSPQHRPAGEEMSDTHKRRLLRFGPVLQVITSRTVKDRMLFLFPDLLIIVKPILPEGQQLDACNLDCRFQCRAIIPLGDVSMALMREEAMSPPDLSKLLDPEVCKAVQQFTAHPYRAIHQLIKKNLLRRDAASVAGFLLRTRGLDRRKVGLLISRPENTPAFAAFMERLPARGIPLPDLLRLVAGHMLLPTASGSTLRLDANNTDNIGESNGTWELHRPAEAVNEDPEARTRCIVMIADRWRTANPDYRLGRRAAIALLHTVLMASQKIATVSTTDTTTATTRLDDFCQLFKCTFANHREDDGHSLFIPDLLLRHTFEATWIRPIRLDDGTESLAPNVLTSTPAPLDKEEDTDPSGRLWISVGTFPLRVTVRVPSPEIVIQLPYPDPHLQLCVVAENGLRSSSDIVEFTADREARITLTGVSVGRCVIAFELMGPNASRYSPIPPRTLSVERSFMRWAFRIRCESTFFSLEDLPIAIFRQPQTSNQDGYDLKKQAGSKAILPTPANGLNGSKSLQPQSRTHQEANSGDEDDDLPLAATAPRLDLGHWRDVAVGQGRAVKLSFSVESRDRQLAWCTMIEERARAIREQRDRTLPANAPVGEADRPGRPTRDRSLATHLARLLLPVTDEQASRSMVFTGKELVKLVGRYDYALRN
ncbi:hypothetical protein BDF19DRAFT_260949 [Syncephalis fuscata]|nr:hypothetical protein BDF19DRAFT_260949 [Syncephalis fuscata]